MTTTDTTVQFMGYTIKAKEDFGGRPFLIDGQWVDSGFVVVKDGANVMPGATWFRTVEEAKKGIACLIVAGDNLDLFWPLMEIAR